MMDLQTYYRKYQALYDDTTNPTIADCLTTAKRTNAKMYRGVCSRHGPMVFWTVDNSCPMCCKIARDARYRDDASRSFNISRMRYNEIKRRGKNTNVPVNITLEEFCQVYDQAPSTCPVLGIPMASYRNEHTDGSASVDRLVPSEGYTKGNIHIISNKADRIKNDGTIEEHLRVAAWMSMAQGGSFIDLQSKLQLIIDELVGGLD